jgi:hypothetical protein
MVHANEEVKGLSDIVFKELFDGKKVFLLEYVELNRISDFNVKISTT